MNKINRPKVFISYASQDKEFALQLERDLWQFGFDVCHDEWEFANGDSIVEKIFADIQSGDSLIIVLSPISVSSRWIRKELDTAVMRRIFENDSKILPVLKEPCKIPFPLCHLRYVDFSHNSEKALCDLLASLFPEHNLWPSLSYLYDYFCLLYNNITSSEKLDAAASEKILDLSSLLDTALHIRTEIEFRKTRQKLQNLEFLGKAGFLADKGVDSRSQTWSAFVTFRARETHGMGGQRATLHIVAELLKDQSNTEKIQEFLEKSMNSLKDIMHTICFDNC